jgi:hypothetical protein
MVVNETYFASLVSLYDPSGNDLTARIIFECISWFVCKSIIFSLYKVQEMNVH